MTARHSKFAGRPPAFAYKGSGKAKSAGVLHCENIPLQRLAGTYGTPLYVYSASTIRDRYLAFDADFGECPHAICYSVKANSNLSILKLLAGLGSGFDVVSGGELERVLRVAPRAAEQVVFSGVGKTAQEMDQALNAGILLFNVESEGEMTLLAQRAAHLHKTARVALRVNPDVFAETHPYISTGLQKHKFGVPISAARKLYLEMARLRGLEVAGVSVHIGSQIVSPDPFRAAIERVARLVRALKSDGHQIRYVDAGGGLGISYHESSAADFPVRLRTYARAITEPLAALGVKVLLEPGRAVVGPAGVLLTRVLYRKRNGSKRFLVVDAAMNDLIRPSLYGAHHEIVPVAPSSQPSHKFDVVGPICETGDFFARDRRLPGASEGELLAILDAGAYGMSISSNYNTRPRAAEVLVEGNSSQLIRRRENINDQLTIEEEAL
ncbi:MAG TPA: diaminopimelate decarboxylase [Terriglobales bacterium]|nr:diaminopimelate decarboxylase [Terriglobales bacterium]